MQVGDSPMTREQNLEHALAEIVAHVKALHAILSSVMVDTAALRQTILVEPADSGVYADNVKAGAKIARPLVDTAMRSYDEIIQRIQDCDEAKNGSPESLSDKSTLVQ